MTDLQQALGANPFVARGDTPLSDQLYAYLRDAIQRGDLLPGQRLVEDSIAAATAVSRTPVREALRKLVATGLAENGSGGRVVAQINAKQVQQLWEVSQSLWMTIARLAAERRSAADLAELTYLVEVAQSGEGIGADPLIIGARVRDCLLRAAGNPYLAEALMRIVVQVEALVDLRNARRAGIQILEDPRMLQALRDRDPDAMEASMQQYLEAILTAWLVDVYRQSDQQQPV